MIKKESKNENRLKRHARIEKQFQEQAKNQE